MQIRGWKGAAIVVACAAAPAMASAAQGAPARSSTVQKVTGGVARADQVIANTLSR